MSVHIIDSEPKYTDPENTRFYKAARVIIENHGNITVGELARRTRLSEESSYQGIIAFRSVVAALHEKRMLAVDVEYTILKRRKATNTSHMLTLDEAKQVLHGETVL